MADLFGVPSGTVLEAVRELCGLEQCGDCECYVLEGERNYSETADVVLCDDCVCCCDWCDDVVMRSDLETLARASGQTYDCCRACRDRLNFFCGECNGFISQDDDSFTVIDGNVWCEDCSYNCFYCCSDCGDFSTREHSCTVCQVCVGCYCTCGDSESESESQLINDYGYKPAPQFRGVGPLYVGLELEVETGNSSEYRGDLAQSVVSALGDLVYIKSDSSLSCGFEIVTHPMSPDYFFGLEAWDRMVRDLAARGCRSWEGHTCGFHVHLSRRAFRSKMHLFAFALFFYRNRDMIRSISGRRSSELDRFASLSMHQGDRTYREPRLIDKVSGRGGGLRNSAVNLTNSTTVEIRFFRGSLRPETLRGAVGLCVAVFEYAATLCSSDVRDGGLEWAKFREWIDRDRFSDLLDLCNRRAV